MLACAGSRSNATGATVPFYLLPGLEIEISASEIRQQVERGVSIASAPDTTCCLMRSATTSPSHGLYR